MKEICLSILCSTGVLILFKLLSRFQANTSHTIFISYAVAAVAGCLILPVLVEELWSRWLVVAAIEGALFYCVFHLMARSSVVSGIAFTGLASKMSVVIPILIGLVFLGEDVNALVVAGIALGLLAMALSVDGSMQISHWRWPVLVFIGSGFIDASFKLWQVWGLSSLQFAGFIVSIFCFAFLTGVGRYLYVDRSSISTASITAGIALGLLNLGTVHFLMQALAGSGFESTLVYSLNSFGIVLMSMLVAILIFKERPSLQGYAGIVVAIASIVILYWSQKI